MAKKVEKILKKKAAGEGKTKFLPTRILLTIIHVYLKS
jgi:hypothetical protein